MEGCGGKGDSKLCARCASGMGCGGWMEEEGRFFVTEWSVCKRAIKKKKRKKEKESGAGTGIYSNRVPRSGTGPGTGTGTGARGKGKDRNRHCTEWVISRRIRWPTHLNIMGGAE